MSRFGIEPGALSGGRGTPTTRRSQADEGDDLIRLARSLPGKEFAKRYKYGTAAREALDAALQRRGKR